MQNRYDGVVWRKGQKVILRPVEETDLPQFQKWVVDESINRFLVRDAPINMTVERAWFDRVSKNDPHHILVAICNLDGVLIGNMSLVIDPIKQSAVTGTIIGRATDKNRGYATDAKMLMLDYAFNWRNVRKVTSKILSFNIASQRYAIRCGYRHVATIPQEHFRDGVWHDELVYVAFREEWQPLWKQYQMAWK